MAEKPALSAAQMRAAEIFAFNDMYQMTVADVAREVGVSERTVYRWKQDPEFIAFQNELAEKIMDDFISEAYWRVRSLARNGNEKTQLKALELALKNRGKLRDVEEKTVEVRDERTNEAIQAEIEALKKQLGNI